MNLRRFENKVIPRRNLLQFKVNEEETNFLSYSFRWIYSLILCNIHKFGQGSKFRKLIIKMIWIVLLFQVRRLSPRHLAQTYHHSLQHFHSKTRFFIKKEQVTVFNIFQKAYSFGKIHILWKLWHLRLSHSMDIIFFWQKIWVNGWLELRTP